MAAVAWTMMPRHSRLVPPVSDIDGGVAWTIVQCYCCIPRQHEGGNGVDDGALVLLGAPHSQDSGGCADDCASRCPLASLVVRGVSNGADDGILALSSCPRVCATAVAAWMLVPWRCQAPPRSCNSGGGMLLSRLPFRAWFQQQGG
jgi:hypothetical protein